MALAFLIVVNNTVHTCYFQAVYNYQTAKFISYHDDVEGLPHQVRRQWVEQCLCEWEVRTDRPTFTRVPVTQGKPLLRGGVPVEGGEISSLSKETTI